MLEPCEKCHSCLLCEAGNHPDVLLVERERGSKLLKISQFVGEDERRHREGLCHDLSLRPLMGRRRVAVIDDADWLNKESANCLLKTLEEPPPGAVIILIGTSRSRQLPTILSRAQVVRFHSLPQEAVRDIALAEGLAGSADAAERLAERSQGSLALARTLADPELCQACQRVAAAWQSGEVDGPRLAREIDELIAAAGKESDARRTRFRQFLNLVTDTLVQSLRRSDLHGASAERTLSAIDRCLEAEDELDRNANQATLLETWLDDLTVLANEVGAGQRR
jgi:DNA polymerase-3 subunit delta'